MVVVTLASDFQDAGLEGNLKNLEYILEEATRKKSSLLNIAGDFSDFHWISNDINKKIEEIITKESENYLSKNPNLETDLKKYLESEQKYLKELMKESGLSLEELQYKLQNGEITVDSSKLYMTPELANFLKDIEKKREGVSKKAYSLENLIKLNQKVYENQKKIFNRYNLNITGIAGNNDTKDIYDILKKNVYFLDKNKEKIVDGIKIVGNNYTNFGIENVYGNLGIGVDRGDNIEELPSDANIYTFHTPPNFANHYINKDENGNVINKLDEFLDNLDNDSKKPILVHVGHSGESGVWGFKNKYDVPVYVINTNVSSNKIAYSHIVYDKNKNIKYIEFYRKPLLN